MKVRDFSNPDADLKSLVEVGYIFEALGVSASDTGCTLVSKGLKQVNQDVPQNVFYLAEIKRIFNCKSLDKIDTSISSVLKDKSLTDSSDLFYAYMLNKDAKLYGSKPSKDFTQTLTD